MTTDTDALNQAEREALIEPMYDAYRLGKYAPSEYLPMWHELTAKPVGTPESVALLAAAEKIIADRTADLLDERDRMLATIARVEALAAEWVADEVPATWVGMAKDRCGRRLRAALAGEDA